MSKFDWAIEFPEEEDEDQYASSDGIDDDILDEDAPGGLSFSGDWIG